MSEKLRKSKMKATLIKLGGSFSDRYYAINIETVEYNFILRTPSYQYPSLTDDEGYKNEGICPRVKEIYTDIINKINKD